MALALLFYGGIAGGVLITGLAGQSAATLNRYLFGSITTVDAADLVVTAVLALVVVVVASGCRAAALRGHPGPGVRAGRRAERARAYNLLVSVLAAVTVTVAMRTVGLLLVSALMVVPVATAQQLTRTFRATLLARDGARARSPRSAGCCLGLRRRRARAPRSCCSRWPASPLAFPVGVLLRRRQRLGGAVRRAGRPLPAATPHTVVPEEHGHEHGPDCGHPAVPHGDHVDYVHDGHRHAPHGGHYDEH